MNKSPSWFVLSLILASLPALRADDEIATTADQLRLTGKYEEAVEQYAKLSETDVVRAAIGLARYELARGQIEEAKKRLADVLAKHASDARLLAELAAIAFQQGDHAAARKHVDAAIKQDENQLLARWYDAELRRVTGQMDEANVGYRWFVRYYNRHQREITDAEGIRYIGLAAAQYARWNRNSSQFSFLVNTLFPKAMRLNEKYWPANLESARLFMEKYNEADALTDLNAALAINPNSAEIHVARAQFALQKFDLTTAKSSLERALQINPKSIDALHLRADLLAANFRLGEAADVLEDARKLNPVHQETLGRLAAIYGATDGLDMDAQGDDDADSRMGAIIGQAVDRNKHCGTFFFTLASTLEGLRKFPYAAKYYQQAQERMPQLVEVSGRLGLMHMRLGEEGQGAKLLNESFEIDPFNVRVKNMLAVLDVLKNYAVIETEHFVIKFDRFVA